MSVYLMLVGLLMFTGCMSIKRYNRDISTLKDGIENSLKGLLKEVRDHDQFFHIHEHSDQLLTKEDVRQMIEGIITEELK